MQHEFAGRKRNTRLQKRNMSKYRIHLDSITCLYKSHVYRNHMFIEVTWLAVTSVPVAVRTPLFSPLRYCPSEVLIAILELPNNCSWNPVASPTRSAEHITWLPSLDQYLPLLPENKPISEDWADDQTKGKQLVFESLYEELLDNTATAAIVSLGEMTIIYMLIMHMSSVNILIVSVHPYTSQVPTI